MRDFIENFSLLDEIANSLNEIPISDLILTWSKCLALKIHKPSLISGIKSEILKRKNLLSESDLLSISRILERENMPEEEKKSLSSVLKNVIFEKNAIKMITLRNFNKQTFFFFV